MARAFARKKKKEKKRRDWTLVVEDSTQNLRDLKNIVISMLFPFTPDPPGQRPLVLCSVENSQILCVFCSAPVALCSCAH
jgi:hypothetical protein